MVKGWQDKTEEKPKAGTPKPQAPYVSSSLRQNRKLDKTLFFRQDMDKEAFTF